MAKPDLVFLTPDNEERISKRIAPQVAAELEKKKAEAKVREEIERKKIDEALKRNARS